MSTRLVLIRPLLVVFVFFFFNDPATTEIYTLSLHDALPISWGARLMATMSARAIATPMILPRELPRKTDRKSTRLNSSHVAISYAVFCLKKKKQKKTEHHTEKHKK